MTSCSVSATPSAYTEGTYPTQIVFAVTTTNSLPAAGSITMAASSAIWSSATSVTCSVTKAGSPDTTTFASGISTTDMSTLVATVQSGQSVGAGVAILFTCTSDLGPFASTGTTVTFSFQSSRDSIVTGVAGWTTVAFYVSGIPPLETNMPCSSVVCPAGYEHRWNAESVLCNGACNVTQDLAMCCVRIGFTSYSWRVQVATSVNESWDLTGLRFYLSDNCSSDSLAVTAPGFNHKWRGWPNGAAFSHHGGHGAVAAELFANPFQGPSSLAVDPTAVKWSSGGPCAPGECFFGFAWESDVNRYPQGQCTAPQRGACSTVGQLRKAGTLRVACAEVEQSQRSGRYADKLRLQLLDVSGRSSNETHAGIWRTAAEVRSLTGGLATLQLPG